MNRKIVTSLLGGGLFLLAALAWAAPSGPDPSLGALRSRVNASPQDSQARLALVEYYYQQAGLTNYFQTRSLFWTEASKKRSDLQVALPNVNEDAAKLLREQLQKLLALEPEQPEGLLRAGDYHVYYRQKEVARWYYQRAAERYPDAVAPRLALADFYLYEFQPDQALAVLVPLQTPLAALRQGAAYWQKGEYPLALGYLLQAEPLPAADLGTRDKMLARAYLAIGDSKAAEELAKKADMTGSAGSFALETQGWAAWQSGDLAAAAKAWTLGKAQFGNARFWDANLWWLQYQKTGMLKNITCNWKDNELRSWVKMLSGFSYQQHDEDLNQAYQDFLEGIKLERRSLVGFLAAGNLQLKRGNYAAAVDLFSQGLAVNPGFGPLIKARAEAYRRLKQTAKAETDEAAAAKAAKALKSQLLQGGLTAGDHGQTLLNLSGATRELFGAWVSNDGVRWQWYPWWGGPLVLKNTVTSAWVVPVGGGLSGEALYLEVAPNHPQEPTVIAELKADGVWFRVPAGARLVVENLTGGGGWVQTEPLPELQVPLGYFNPGRQDLRCWTQERNSGVWRRSYLAVQIPVMAQPAALAFTVDAAALIRQSRLNLRITVEQGVLAGLRMTVAEQGNTPGEWLPYQPEIACQLAAGDGTKTVVIRLRDRFGNVAEQTVTTHVDTTPPQVTASDIVATGAAEPLQVSWSFNERVSARLRLFHVETGWHELPVTPGAANQIRVSFDPTGEVFSQLLVQDEAGNVARYLPTRLNTALQQNVPVHFLIGEDPTAVVTAWVSLRPVPGNNLGELQWSVSNDLRLWSPWRQGETPLLWKTAATAGERWVYIRFRLPNQAEQMTVVAMPDSGNAVSPDLKD